jgi:RNA polymerase primary sigma factor
MEDLYQSFLKQLKKYKVLPVEEQKLLCKRAQEGDLPSRHKLIMSTQRYVISQAIKYSYDHELLADLISEACIGLNRAIDTYNPEKGTVFLTHANTWIFQAIQRYFSEEHRAVRVPLSRRQDRVFFTSMDDTSTTEEGFHPYDKYLQPDIDNTPDVLLDNKLKKAYLAKLLSKLDSREKYIVSLYFGLNNKKEMTYQQIGSELKLSGERVRNLLNTALIKLGVDLKLRQIK